MTALDRAAYALNRRGHRRTAAALWRLWRQTPQGRAYCAAQRRTGAYCA